MIPVDIRGLQFFLLFKWYTNNLNEFHVEDEGGACFDCTHASLSVGQFGRNYEFAPLADAHTNVNCKAVEDTLVSLDPSL
jgi:hypothetical protein